MLSAGLQKAGFSGYEGLEGVLAVLIAHFSHLLSTLLLFMLTPAVFPACSTRFSFTAAVLHIISPGGLFLSAPYAESSCAMLSFAGCLLFVKSLTVGGQNTLGHDLLVVSSGISFGIATTFRSNGILNGLLLLEEAFKVLWSLRNDPSLNKMRRLVATGLGGLFVGSGFLIPQYIAWSEYCQEPDVTTFRPWCEKSLPSIYAFVQDYYWFVQLLSLFTRDSVLMSLGIMAYSGIGPSQTFRFSSLLRRCL
jgi:phosphatidylinositol glycan class V